MTSCIWSKEKLSEKSVQTLLRVIIQLMAILTWFILLTASFIWHVCKVSLALKLCLDGGAAVHNIVLFIYLFCIIDIHTIRTSWLSIILLFFFFFPVVISIAFFMKCSLIKLQFMQPRWCFCSVKHVTLGGKHWEMPFCMVDTGLQKCQFT